MTAPIYAVGDIHGQLSMLDNPPTAPKTRRSHRPSVTLSVALRAISSPQLTEQ